MTPCFKLRYRPGLIPLTFSFREIALTVLVITVIAHCQQGNTREPYYEIDSGSSQTTQTASNSSVLIVLVVGSVVALSLMFGDWDHIRESLPRKQEATVNMSSYSTTRESDTTSWIRRFSWKTTYRRRRDGLSPISSRDPFLPNEVTAALTLSDVKSLFEYAASLKDSASVVNATYKSYRSAYQRAAVAALDRVAASRVTSQPYNSLGEMDALTLVAVCRIFDEWRMFHLVPVGYRGYALGMILASRELLFHLAQMEGAVDSYLAHQKKTTESTVKGPTLRQLLEFEATTGLDTQLSESADCGLSGLLRHLQYQTSILENITHVPVLFPDARAALQAAYQSTFASHHGLLARYFLEMILRSAVDASVILECMNATARNLDGTATQPSSDCSDGEGDRSLNEWHESRQRSEHPLEKLGDHISREWTRFHSFVGQCTGRAMEGNSSRNIIAPLNAKTLALTETTLQVQAFVGYLQPFMNELSTLVKDFNVNTVAATPTTSDSGSAVPEKISCHGIARPTNGRNSYALVISSRSLFVSSDTIAALTLGELSETIRFVVESSREGFNLSQFLESVPVRVHPVVEAVCSVVEQSRGPNVQNAVATQAEDSCGQIDALKFAAVMRIFAEWQVLRAVPEGYKGYAVGMKLGHKDALQNVAKMEQAVHRWLEYQGNLLSAHPRSDLRAPTLFELMLYEIETEVNPSDQLPKLDDKSGTMGLLWVRRQLHYQAKGFANALKTPGHFACMQDACHAAYQEVYGSYHGWTVRKIFTLSIKATPKAEVMYRHMNPHLHAKTHEKLEKASNTSVLAQLSDEGKEAFVAKEATRDGHAQIQVFLKTVNPFLADLELLFEKLNMNDPTRV